MNDKGVYRTAPATPGLLNIHLINWLQNNIFKWLPLHWQRQRPRSYLPEEQGSQPPVLSLQAAVLGYPHVLLAAG